MEKIFEQKETKSTKGLRSVVLTMFLSFFGKRVENEGGWNILRSLRYLLFKLFNQRKLNKPRHYRGEDLTEKTEELKRFFSAL